MSGSYDNYLFLLLCFFQRLRGFISGFLSFYTVIVTFLSFNLLLLVEKENNEMETLLGNEHIKITLFEATISESLGDSLRDVKGRLELCPKLKYRNLADSAAESRVPLGVLRKRDGAV